MSLLERPAAPTFFKPPVLKRSIVPQRPSSNEGRMMMGNGGDASVGGAMMGSNGCPYGSSGVGGLNSGGGMHTNSTNNMMNTNSNNGSVGPAGGATTGISRPNGLVPVGLSPGLGPSNPTLLVMPSLSIETPMSVPIVKERPRISEASISSRSYTREEFMSLRSECANTPTAVLEWVLSLYRTDGGVGGLRCPPHLRLLVDELEADRTGALLGGVGRKNARPVRALHHKVMSILSRLTPQKYELLKEELFQLPLKQMSDSELREVVKVFFNKSVQEHKFSDLYARLVSDICAMTEAEAKLEQATRERLLQNRMRSELLTACQEEFNRPLQLTEKDRFNGTTGEPLPEEEIARKRETLKMRLVGNIKFVGELYKFHLVNPRVVNSIFNILVSDFDESNPTAKEDYMFEVFGMLLKTVGTRLSVEDPACVENVMKMVCCIRDTHPTSRVRFSMMDLIDLNAKGWVQKKEVLTHQEQETAHFEKAARENATLDRQKAQLRTGGGGGGMGGMAGSSSNLTTPVSEHGGKFGGTPTAGGPKRPVTSLGVGLTSTATPVSASGRSFPASVSGSPLTNGTPNYASIAGGRKVPGPNPTIVTTSAAGGHRATPVTAGGGGGVPSSPLGTGPRGTALASASASSSSATPLMQSVSRESANDMAGRLMREFNNEANRGRVLNTLKTIERNVCIPVLTSWIRETVMTTRLFTERENLPHLFFAITARCEDRNEMILSSSDLLNTVLEWLRLDMEQARFNECPRFFANWASVVSRAFKLAMESNPTNRMQWARVLSVLSCSTFTLALRELVTREYRSVMATAIRDMNAVARDCALFGDAMAGRDPQKILSFATMARFRLLPYVIKADEGDTIRVPITPSLGPAPTAQPIGMGPAGDPYHECFRIPQDDAELNLFKRVVRRTEGYTQSIQGAIDAIPPTQNVTRIIVMMKVTAASLSLLNPPTGEKPLLPEEEVVMILRETVRRIPADLQPIAQAAIVMEMICFYCSNTNKLLGIGGSNSPSISISSTPSKSRDDSQAALSAVAETFRRWVDVGVVDRTTVLATLQSVAPIAVPSTPGTPPRLSSAAGLDAMDSSFTLPEPVSHRVATPLIGASTASCPSTPQIGAASSLTGGLRGAAASFRFDMCEMLVRNMNFVSSLKWSSVLNQLQK